MEDNVRFRTVDFEAKLRAIIHEELKQLPDRSRWTAYGDVIEVADLKTDGHCSVGFASDHVVARYRKTNTEAKGAQRIALLRAFRRRDAVGAKKQG